MRRRSSRALSTTHTPSFCTHPKEYSGWCDFTEGTNSLSSYVSLCATSRNAIESGPPWSNWASAYSTSSDLCGARTDPRGHTLMLAKVFRMSSRDSTSGNRRESIELQRLIKHHNDDRPRHQRSREFAARSRGRVSATVERINPKPPILTSKMVSHWRRLVTQESRDGGGGLVQFSANSFSLRHVANEKALFSNVSASFRL